MEMKLPPLNVTTLHADIDFASKDLKMASCAACAWIVYRHHHYIGHIYKQQDSSLGHVCSVYARGQCSVRARELQCACKRTTVCVQENYSVRARGLCSVQEDYVVCVQKDYVVCVQEDYVVCKRTM